MKVNNWLVYLLLFVGISVGGMSLYMASLSGVMTKMGLVGGDFGQSIDTNELARQMRSQDEILDCGTMNVAKAIPNYLFSKGENKIKLAGELGKERVICGVRLVQAKNVERGVYTLIKGLYYLKTYYTEMRILIESDRNQCQMFGDPTYERWVEGYLMATEGRVHEVVLSVYSEVERSRARVAELCLD
ncbi:MAG: hypothetical protein WCG44_00935 [bacterium]